MLNYLPPLSDSVLFPPPKKKSDIINGCSLRCLAFVFKFKKISIKQVILLTFLLFLLVLALFSKFEMFETFLNNKISTLCLWQLSDWSKKLVPKTQSVDLLFKNVLKISNFEKKVVYSQKAGMPILMQNSVHTLCNRLLRTLTLLL